MRYVSPVPISAFTNVETGNDRVHLNEPDFTHIYGPLKDEKYS